MRRNKSKGLIKTLSLSAAIVALSYGSTISVEAAEADILRVLDASGTGYTDIRVDSLTDATLREKIKASFMAAEKMYLSVDDGENWVEFGQGARAQATDNGNFLNAPDAVPPDPYEFA